MNKQIITIKTNIRNLADKRYSKQWKKYHGRGGGSWWQKILHGSSLASVGLCLQVNLDLILIAGSGIAREKLTPCGSHPDLDKFWSNEKLEFRHDEIETRMNKIKYLSKYPLLLNNLRVCYSKKIGNINCGLCEKCIRTVIALKLSGVKPSPDTFDRIPDIKEIKICRFDQKGPASFFWEQMLEEALSQENTEFANAIAIALGKKFSFYRCSMLTLHNIKSKFSKLFRKARRKLLPQPLRKRIKSIYTRLVLNPQNQTKSHR